MTLAEARTANRGPNWQPHEDATLTAMWAAGATFAEVAERTGRSRRAVNARRKKLGLPPRTEPAGAWPPERDARLAELAAADKSARYIADQLGSGLTRSAVIARAHRLGIKLTGKIGAPPARKTQTARRAKGAPAANRNMAAWSAQQKAAVKPPPLPELPPCEGRIAIADLGPRHCRYIGERPDLITMDTPIYCGTHAPEGSSWCAEHRAVVFNAGARPVPCRSEAPLRHWPRR